MLKKFLIHLTFLSLFLIIGVVAIGHAQTASPEASITQASWVVDPEITFMGQQAAFASTYFDNAIQEQHNWVGDTPLPLIVLIFVSMSLFVLARQNKTLGFVPVWARMLMITILSYASILVLYQFLNMLQSIMLSPTLGAFCPSICISQQDFIFAGSSPDFVGSRLVGAMYDDEVALNVLLTRLTAITYNIMVILIILQKIILMAFLIISPFILISLMRATVSKTTKVAVREFLRWVFIVPLFALSLTLTASLWSSMFPSLFVWLGKFLDNETIWPTASNILLGYPGQYVSIVNHVNSQEALVFYIISLVSMWIAIIVPLILAHIIVRRVVNYPWRDNETVRKFILFASLDKPTKNTSND